MIDRPNTKRVLKIEFHVHFGVLWHSNCILWAWVASRSNPVPHLPKSLWWSVCENHYDKQYNLLGAILISWLFCLSCPWCRDQLQNVSAVEAYRKVYDNSMIGRQVEVCLSIIYSFSVCESCMAIIRGWQLCKLPLLPTSPPHISLPPPCPSGGRGGPRVQLGRWRPHDPQGHGELGRALTFYHLISKVFVNTLICREDVNTNILWQKRCWWRCARGQE